jgi:ankyrin repeat protein
MIPDLDKLLTRKPHLANVTDDDGRVPLMVHWHSFVFDILLKHGANPNACDIRGNTVLMYQRKHLGLIETLVAAGANINARNKAGKALITMALEEGLPIQPLLDAGAEWQPIPRDKKNEIFLNCLSRESIDVLSRIVSEYRPSEETYHFALVWSGCRDQEKFNWLKSLREYYPTLPKNRLTEKEEQVFMQVCSGLRKHDTDSQSFKTWLSNMEECLGDRSALDRYLVRDPAVLLGVKNTDILEILLNAGADPNLGMKWKDDTDITTILYTAVHSRNARAVRLLLEHGADPTTGTSYMDIDDTCVACAIRNNDLDILQMLIEAGADLDFAIRCNRTPIITAIREDNLAALKMLVEAGANPDLADEYGRIPAEYLNKEKNSQELCSYFESVADPK